MRDKAKHSEHNRKYREANRERINERMREYNARPEVKLRSRAGKRRLHYGVTQDQFDRRLSEQGHCCAVCNSDDPKGPWHTWSADHDHTTGQFRGVLCHNCNLMLGHGYDSPELLRRGADYLTAWRALALLQIEIEEERKLQQPSPPA